MLKFILHTLLIFAITVVLYIPLVIIWAEWDYDSFVRKNVWYELKEAYIDDKGYVNSFGHMFSRMKEVNETSNVDLLVIGSSQAYRGFDPRIFNEAGIRIFNLGSSNQSPLQSDVLLRKYIDRLNPKTVIYVVYPEVFSVDGVESTLDILANDNVDLQMVKLVISQKNFKLINTLIYMIYRQIFDLNSHYNEKWRKGNDTYISGGFVEKDFACYRHEKWDQGMWDFKPKQFKAFYRSLRLLREKGIKIILVQTPTASAYYKSFYNNNVFDSIMDNTEAYYNFNDIIALDDSLFFYDRFHLNKNGVDTFDQKFLQLLGDEIN